VAEEGAVEAFALDACGGLRRIGAVPAAGTPDGLAPSPDGRFVYALDGDGRVQGFRVGQGGALVALAAPAVPAGRGAQAAAFSPSGRHLYVADAEADAIFCYARDPATGALAPLRPASVPTGDGSTPWALAVAPSGRYLYVVERGADAVVRYDIRPATGTLVPATRGSTASDGIYPRSIVLSSDGRYAYVANESDTIAEFSVRDDGSLVPLPDSPLTLAGEIPWQIVLAPSGRYAYVVNQGGFVMEYAVNRTGQTMASEGFAAGPGELLPIPGAPTAVGSAPTALALDPTARFAYVLEGYADRVLVFHVAPDGLLVPAPGGARTGADPSALAVVALPTGAGA
jgi:6-phosphogluconolactonase